jgi:hypothetical protein
LDDADALEASKPKVMDGQMELDIAREEREDAPSDPQGHLKCTAAQGERLPIRRAVGENKWM